jgi:hypothetical protein
MSLPLHDSLATDAVVSTAGVNFFWAESEPDALLVQIAEHGRSIIQKHHFSVSIGGDAYNKPNAILFRLHNATHVQIIRQESGAPFYVYVGLQLSGRPHVSSCDTPFQLVPFQTRPPASLLDSWMLLPNHSIFHLQFSLTHIHPSSPPTLTDPHPHGGSGRDGDGRQGSSPAKSPRQAMAPVHELRWAHLSWR